MFGPATEQCIYEHAKLLYMILHSKYLVSKLYIVTLQIY